ncbi:MAG: AAA family ATPase, partial [Nitrospirae bacterium]|nr:AAA family ATPase [Nitrospirota bacterium]
RFSAGAALESEAENLRHELAEGNEALRELESGLSGKEDFIESKRREVFSLAEEISHIRNELGKLLTTMENLERKHAVTLSEAASAREHLEQVETGLRDTDGTLASRNSDLLSMNEQKGRIAAEIEEFRAGMEESRGALSKAREDLASATSRLHSLREILHEDLPKEALEEHLQILASVAEIVDVDERYEKAIENALAEKVKGFLVPSFGDISGAAPSLKEKGIRRTSFVPVNEPAEGDGGAFLPDLTVSGGSLIGRAIDLIGTQSGNNPFPVVVKRLLQNTLIVRDLPGALALLSEFCANGNPVFTLVTLDGETVEPSGAVSVGEGKGILRRKRETRELETLIEQKRSETERLSETLSAMENSLHDRQAALKEIESRVVHAEKEISLLRLTAENRNEEKERICRKLSYLGLEGEEILKEKESLRSLGAEKEAEAGRIAGRKDEAERLVAAAQEEIAVNKARCEAERASITELRLSLNSYKERIESLRKEGEASLAMLSDLSEMQERLAGEKADIDSRVFQCADEIARNNDTLKGLVLKADHLRTAITESREVIRSESEELIRFEQELKAHRNRFDSLSAAINEADVSIAEHKLKMENLSGNVSRDYGLEIASFDSEPLVAEEEERLPEIRRKIQELGPVNLGTIEEYEELKARYDFLTKQQEDLNKSIAELEEAITKINSTTRRKLREAYEQLNAKFSEVFTLLFGGGKAALVLTDENSILDSGIDIVVQPPGKKLQNITLLSGGEKALTALSLLFASFLLKPSPLCILDEVDAALDESNIGRFAKMLRELAGNIQFIVITHSRTTMEAADYIYGITMEEPGVSKVISMQLVES